MKQPFELKYIKRYMILYIGVVISMALFYFLNSSNNPVEKLEKKEFSTTVTKKEGVVETIELQNNHGIKLLDKSY